MVHFVMTYKLFFRKGYLIDLFLISFFLTTYANRKKLIDYEKKMHFHFKMPDQNICLVQRYNTNMSSYKQCQSVKEIFF